MRPPITFVHGNLVFGEQLEDVWAVYRLETRSYAGMTNGQKRELLSQLAAFAYAIEADFTILRVTRPWSVEQYEAGVRATVDPRHVRDAELDAHLATHCQALASRRSHQPEVYVSVRLRDDDRRSAIAGLPSLSGVLRRVGLGDPRAITRRRLAGLLAAENKVHQRVFDFLLCERAATHEVQWLIRRSLFRAIGDPDLDERFAPQALVIDAPDDDEVRYEPLEVDMLRLLDAPIRVDRRALTVETEQGRSHQAFLCVGALPETMTFPSEQAELLFAPLENVDFPVDAVFSARYVGNDDALRLVRRRLVDADHIFREESHGDHGPSASAADRPAVVRELEDYLSGGERPPLLRAAISLCVAAGDADELEDRVERLRREYGAIKLHRPLGDQLPLFVSHLPGQASRVAHYDDYLTVEQLGAMVPTATHAVGAEAGPYIGTTLAGAAQPVLFDPTEASRTSRAPAVLLAGTLGSGKTMCLELMMYQAFLCGSTVVDIDPKGDHALERLPGVAERCEIVELSADERFRGMLDPLRIGPPETREDLAVNFLLSILPEPISPDWQTEIRLAVQVVAARGGRACGEVIAELEGGGEHARAAGRALGVHAGSGIARLGFAAPDASFAAAGSAQVTSLRIRNLSLPLPGTPRAELLEEERVGRAILHLLAVYALSLTSRDRRRHSVLGIDEAWVLLADSAGRALIDRISRQGRAMNVVPFLATQVIGDAGELEDLIGATFCFGVESEREAGAALRLLQLDEDDPELVQRLLAFRRGRCYMRDYSGRVSPVQVDLVDRELLRTLDTTPSRDDDPLEADATEAGAGAATV
ncbi:MAG TPA: ATP-binding protein [Conexibacter sp.]|nr:ATP-binding protein [Conexibacter sp.]